MYGIDPATASTRPIRVVHVAPQLEVGGLEKLLVEFARHGDRMRVDARFVALGAGGRPAEDIQALGHPVDIIGQPNGLRPGLVWKLARRFRDWGIDIVHTHNTRPLIYATAAARLAGCRAVVHTRHGQRFGAGRRETAAFRAAARLADRVVCVSKDGAQLSLSEGLPRRKLTTIPNGIDVRRFAYVGSHAGGPVVTVGRLSAEKDIATLLRAARAAVAIEPSIRFAIAGDGPSRLALESLSRELGLAESVSFLGDVRDVPSLLANASLYVQSSLTEGISLTLLEAMARGLPAVATRVGGNLEVVTDGTTGQLVPPRDPAALAAAILRMWRQPDEALRFGRAAREQIETRFDVRRMVRQYESLYAELVRPQRPQSGLCNPEQRMDRMERMAARNGCREAVA